MAWSGLVLRAAWQARYPGAMTGLRVALLGSPRIEVAGMPLRVDTRKAVALLAYLACSGRRHGRDQLAVLLWPCAEPLRAAVALHRGDFLAGFSLRDAPEFEDWQLAEVEALRREQAGALQRLVEAYAVQGRWQAAIAGAERWLALDSLHEPAHRQLMRLYAWSGQRGAAM